MVMLISSTAAAQFQLTNLVSNQAGAAKHTDPLLVNAWGLTYGPGGPFWISDSGSGWSTLYDGNGISRAWCACTHAGATAGNAHRLLNGFAGVPRCQGWPSHLLVRDARWNDQWLGAPRKSTRRCDCCWKPVGRRLHRLRDPPNKPAR